MAKRILEIILVVGLIAPLVSCAPQCRTYENPSLRCYNAYRQSSLRAAERGGTAIGKAMGGESLRRSASTFRPYWVFYPTYDLMLDQAAGAMLGH